MLGNTVLHIQTFRMTISLLNGKVSIRLNKAELYASRFQEMTDTEY